MTDLKLILSAAAFAAERHRDHRRKDAAASPYINHPLEVARILAAEGGVTDEAIIAAALLHDTVEDTQTSPAELVERFGREIAALVAEVTDDKSLPKATRKALQIEHAPHTSAKAAAVKLADKIANLRDVATNPPSRWDTDRRADYASWSAQVVDGLRGRHPALENAFDAALSAARAALPP